MYTFYALVLICIVLALTDFGGGAPPSNEDWV